ncbi:ParA family protein [Marinisporobacter balticus]|uniref:Chromosome partitioning protein n=1 Tax=Marinisporobacter balticus TaxID=2018667 RepID=A0A4R2KBP0_9FIRM|nr:ParA family protein [Marinisporobacter balticus]TCO69477.1 chromosome partitioning protein [Marinisporobacter balticus]
MKVISFGTLKGGTGKTTTTFSTAGILQEMGKKVLCCDLDPQANLTYNFGINVDEDTKTLLDVFEDDETLPVKVVQHCDGIDLIPSTIKLTGTEMQLVNYPGREYILKNFIEDHHDFFNQYDYVLIDTNPSMSILNQNAFISSDAIILVNEAGAHSLTGSLLFMDLWEGITKRLRIKNNIKGFLINRFRKTKISNEFVSHCKTHARINDILFNTIIPINVKVAEAETESTPISAYSKNSTGAIAFKNFVKELIERV